MIFPGIQWVLQDGHWLYLVAAGFELALVGGLVYGIVTDIAKGIAAMPKGSMKALWPF
jgi:hypothetical protein